MFSPALLLMDLAKRLIQQKRRGSMTLKTELTLNI
jgi:hypothetical protein